jgi:MYXO-CTERM domain-containing protein
MPDALRTLALLTFLLAVPTLAAVPTVWAEALAPQVGCTAGGGTAALGGVFLLAALVLMERWRTRKRR